MILITKQFERYNIHGLVIMMCSIMLFIAGCGGGGDGAGEPIDHSGVFVDSPVEGLDYETSSKFGLTGPSGSFNYRKGEMITFSIGDVILGKAMANDFLTPIDLVLVAADETDSTVTNICRLLQSLDQDGNSQNGILITPQIRAEVVGRPIDFNLSISQFENDPAILGLFETLNALNLFTGDMPRQLIPAAVAQNHLRATLNNPEIDGDGYSESQGDCNDYDSSINPGAIDICGDGIDQDCNGQDLECDPVDPDTDSDGYSESQGDCNDDDSSVNPGAIDICGDGIDQDCNGQDLECGPDYGAYETQLLDLISSYRINNALALISFNAHLNSLAAEHSQYMYNQDSLSHDGFYDRAASSGFNYCVENVGWNYSTPEAQFNGWRNSPGHNQNMLNPNIDYAGISKVGSFVTFFACGN